MPYRQDARSWADQPTAPIPTGHGAPSAAPGGRVDRDPHTDPVGLPVTGVARARPAGGTIGDLGAAQDPGGPKHGAPLSPRLLVPLGVLALLLVAYLVDLIATRDDLPRGTVVAGVDIGGLSTFAADRELRRVLEPVQDRPVPVRAGVLETSLQPGSAGLRVDWAGTLAAAGGQPLNPLTRLGSAFGKTHEVAVRTLADNDALTDVLDGMSLLIRKPPIDAGVRFEGTMPVAVQPAPGEELDVPAAAAEIRREWLTGVSIALPIRRVPPTGGVSEQTVQDTLNEVAAPAVSSEVTVAGQDNYRASLSPLAIAQALSFTPDGQGGLTPVLDLPRIEESLRPQLAVTERAGRDATVRLVGGRPVIEPSVDGRGVDYPATLAGLLAVLKRPADPANADARRIVAVYADRPAKRTTAQLASLGIKDLVSQFSTSGFARDSGQNIRRAAEQINGTILLPGETFSLNGTTGRRDAASGYVEAGVIQDGHPDRGIGGGVSQLATTLYNAAYFAGMVDVAHQEHSYYISRYPVAREATVYGDIIDLKFRNDARTAIFLETVWTPSSITVKFWGTKHYEVTSSTGPRTDPVPPQTLTIPAGQPCKPSQGGPGFTATDTRTLRDLETGESRSDSHTVKYKPSPKVVCAGGPPKPATGGTTPPGR